MARPQEVRSVDAFSQLPFIRSPPPKQQQARGDTTIRLFGCEFSNSDALSPQHKLEAAGFQDAGKSTVTSDGNSGAAAGEASRKFECHYCCRIFPTSQALGGHQNAHKRERQHAKRAHLHASLAMHRYLPGHMYLNYQHHNLAGRYVDHQQPPPHYPMWTAGGGSPGDDYGGPGSVLQPIDGSPIVHGQGLWMVQPSQPMESLSPARLVAVPAGEVTMSCKDGEKTVVMSLLSSSPPLWSCSSTSSDQKLGKCKLGQQQQEALSLDLHL